MRFALTRATEAPHVAQVSQRRTWGNFRWTIPGALRAYPGYGSAARNPGTPKARQGLDFDIALDGAGMVLYRRNLIAGGTYFFTLTLNDRRSDLLVRQVDKLRASWKSAQIRVPHGVIAAVVMPDHLHAVIEMPTGNSDYARLWQEVKKGFTRRILDAGMAVPQHSNGEYALWQRRYWEHTIRDEADLVAHVDYVHFNPVKHGHATCVRDWPHSSFHRYVAEGKLAVDWGDTPPTEPLAAEFGE